MALKSTSAAVEVQSAKVADSAVIDWPQPRWQASSACRMTVTLPVQSKV